MRLCNYIFVNVGRDNKANARNA